MQPPLVSDIPSCSWDVFDIELDILLLLFFILPEDSIKWEIIAIQPLTSAWMQESQYSWGAFYWWDIVTNNMSDDHLEITYE